MKNEMKTIKNILMQQMQYDIIHVHKVCQMTSTNIRKQKQQGEENNKSNIYIIFKFIYTHKCSYVFYIYRVYTTLFLQSLYHTVDFVIITQTHGEIQQNCLIFF